MRKAKVIKASTHTPGAAGWWILQTINGQAPVILTARYKTRAAAKRDLWMWSD